MIFTELIFSLYWNAHRVTSEQLTHASACLAKVGSERRTMRVYLECETTDHTRGNIRELTPQELQTHVLVSIVL